MTGRAHAADTLCVHLGIARVSTTEYYFKASEHHA
jgi:hypothetical protein